MLLVGWEASAAHVRRMESARLQEERVAAGLKKMLPETSPEELCGLLLDALFDILPAYYGFAVLSSSTLQYYCVVSKKFQTPDGFRLEKDTWTNWVLTRPGETLYLEGTTSRETTMPILFRGEPFHADRVVLVHPLVAGEERFGVVGLVGRASNPFSERDRGHASALLGPGVALLDLALLHLTQKNLAIRDALTGLFNRRHMDETLVVELKRAERQGSHCAVILMDLDHFKTVNDTHGHEAGDVVLRTVAQRVRDNVREIDVVCRYGGEEFAVILPECDGSEAMKVAERIHRAVGDSPFQVTDEASMPVTVSLGVSGFPTPSNSLTSLVRSVDAALYEAKRKGRNRVVLGGR
jgi:diguanylate cyclase (GGDEF)-like protein